MSETLVGRVDGVTERNVSLRSEQGLLNVGSGTLSSRYTVGPGDAPDPTPPQPGRGGRPDGVSPGSRGTSEATNAAPQITSDT